MATEQRPQDLLFEDEFSNWAKAVLSLQNARDGSINYIKRKIEQRMYGSDKKKNFTELLSELALNEYAMAELNVGSRLMKWIRNSTEKHIDPSSYWWVLAKTYIPKLVHAERPEEVESSAIFMLLLNCQLFFDRGINKCCKKLVKMRNELIHSANNRLTRQKMIERFDLIKEFLKLVADNTNEVNSEVEKLEKSTVVLFDENGKLSKLAEEALQLQEQSLNADLESSDVIKRLTIKPLKLLARPIYQVLSSNDINVRVDTDGNECIITDMCQMSDGTVVVIDFRNEKLKRLDDNFNVRDINQFDLTPRYIVPVSSSQVAIFDGSWKIDLITVGESIVHERRIDLEIKDESKYSFGFEYCNKQFWICGKKGIYIHSLSGSLVKCIKNDLFEGQIDGQSYYRCSICTNKDRTRVYVTNGRTVYVFNTYGKVLFTFPIGRSSWPIITTIDDNLIASYNDDDDSNHIDMYDNCKILDEFITGIKKMPLSLLFDEKKCCLIVAFHDDTIKVFQLQKRVI